jgi:putative addiction module CopG family antidote
MGILEPGLQRFIDEQIASGRHATADEVVEAALRYYRYAVEEDARIVREAAEEGIADIEAGRYQTIEDPAQFHAIFQEKLDRLEAAMRRKQGGKAA